MVDKYGHFTGHDITFVYQDLLTGLRGHAVSGVLQEAPAVDVVGERCRNGIKELKFKQALGDKDITWTWSRHETNENFI